MSKDDAAQGDKNCFAVVERAVKERIQEYARGEASAAPSSEETRSDLPAKLRKQKFYDADEEIIHQGADRIEQLERELTKAKHDLERATANHSADLSAIAPTTDEVAARVSSAGVNFDKMKDHAKQLENALRAMLKEYEGVFDKVDSQGKPYQSEGAKRAERLAFQLINPMDSTTTNEKP